MGFLTRIFRAAPDFGGAVVRAERALYPQVRKLLILDPDSNAGRKKLTSAGLLCLLHGFVAYYCDRHHVRAAEQKLAATHRVFANLFGERAALLMVEALQAAMQEKQNWGFLIEGERAAKHYEKDSLNLIAAFLGDP